MIKNTLIAILSLTVIGLSWMSFAGLKNTQEFKQDFQQKILELKSQIHDAYRATYQQDDSGHEFTSSPDVPEVKHQEKTTHKLATEEESNIERNIPRPEKSQQSNQSAADILNEVKQKPDDNDNRMSPKELESVLSYLKSAQQLLGKTSFTFTHEPVDTNPKGVKHEKITIKKNCPMVPRNRNRSKPCPGNGLCRVSLQQTSCVAQRCLWCHAGYAENRCTVRRLPSRAV